MGETTAALAGEWNRIHAVIGCKLFFTFCFFVYLRGGEFVNHYGDRWQRGTKGVNAACHHIIQSFILVSLLIHKKGALIY
jgi:hypothetical protein